MKLRIPTLAALAVVQVLATSCGGGGGGGGGGDSGRPFADVPEASSNANSLHDAVVRGGKEESEAVAELEDSFDDLVENEPTYESDGNSLVRAGGPADEVRANHQADSTTMVSQSSSSDVTVALSGINGRDAENVQIAVQESQGNFEFMLTSEEDIDDTDDTDVAVVNFGPVTITNTNSNGLAAASALVVFDRPGDTNWVALGLWAHTVDYTTNSPSWDIGFFAGTSNVYRESVAELTGVYRYSGYAIGTSIWKKVDDEYGIDTYSAEVDLVADFGDSSALGSIGGSLSNFDLDDDNDDVDYGGLRITLKVAEIGVDDGGFFTGDIASVDPDDNEYGSGKWGGQFYGDGAEGVLGTYSGNVGSSEFSIDNVLSTVWIAGAFIAEENGGGGGDPAMVTVDVAFELNAGTAGAFENLALAEPREGSVSQSSNRDGSDVTQDSVEVYGLDDAISDDFSMVTIAVSGDVTMTLSEANADNFEAFVTTGVTVVKAFWERSNENEYSGAEVLVYYNLKGNTDWAAVGSWFDVADITSTDPNDWNLGFFADTDNPYPGRPATDLTGTATYEGTAEVYVVTLDDTDAYERIYFTADAVLNADFDNNNINGRIENLYNTVADEFNAVTEDLVGVLKDATLTDDNFFNGEVRVRTGPSGTEYGEGNWGGQFFGDDAEGVIGTYGGFFDDDTFIESFASG